MDRWWLLLLPIGVCAVTLVVAMAVLRRHHHRTRSPERPASGVGRVADMAPAARHDLTLRR